MLHEGDDSDDFALHAERPLHGVTVNAAPAPKIKAPTGDIAHERRLLLRIISARRKFRRS
jgi:hypothetical protein